MDPKQGYFSPACFHMALSVPMGRSFLGCGTVIFPLRVGCLK